MTVEVYSDILKISKVRIVTFSHEINLRITYRLLYRKSGQNTWTVSHSKNVAVFRQIVTD